MKGAEIRLLEQQCHQCKPTVMPLSQCRALMPEMEAINSNAREQVSIPLYISVLFCLCSQTCRISLEMTHKPVVIVLDFS